MYKHAGKMQVKRSTGLKNVIMPDDSVYLSMYNLSILFHIIFMSDQMFHSETRTLLVSHLYLFLL